MYMQITVIHTDNSSKSVVFKMHCDTDKSDVLMGCVYIILNMIHNQLQ